MAIWRMPRWYGVLSNPATSVLSLARFGWDVVNKRMRIGDGSKLGGHVVATLDDIDTVGAKADAAAADATNALGGPQINGPQLQWGSLPNLARVLRNQWYPVTHNGAARRIRIAGCGDSTDHGDGASKSPVESLCDALQAIFDPSAELFVFEAVNLAVGGTTYNEWVTTLWASLVAAHAASPLTAVVIGGVMNTGSTNFFNTGGTYPSVGTSIETFAKRMREVLKIDLIEFIPPPCNTERYYAAGNMNPILPMLYPYLGYDFIDNFTFVGASKKIVSSINGAFLEAAGHGAFLTVGKKITVKSGVNAGDYTLVAIDPNGNYVVVAENFVSETTYSCEVARTHFDPDELTPVATIEGSTTDVDILGTGKKVRFDKRFGMIHRDKRFVASDPRLAHAIWDCTPWWAIAANKGQDRLFSSYETNEVHFNDVMYAEVVDPSAYAFARALYGCCYGGGKGGIAIPTWLHRLCIRGDRSIWTTDNDLTFDAAFDVQPSDADTYVSVERSVAGVIIHSRKQDNSEQLSIGSKIETITRGNTYQNSTANPVTIAITGSFTLEIVARHPFQGLQIIELNGGVNMAGTALTYTAATKHNEAVTPVTVTSSGLNVVITPSNTLITITWVLRQRPY